MPTPSLFPVFLKAQSGGGTGFGGNLSLDFPVIIETRTTTTEVTVLSDLLNVETAYNIDVETDPDTVEIDFGPDDLEVEIKCQP